MGLEMEQESEKGLNSSYTKKHGGDLKREKRIGAKRFDVLLYEGKKK